jgi:TetR/AcrR family transcriptional regulator, cholesterol catabolism regulator
MKEIESRRSATYEKKRKEILDTALALFASRGFEGTTVEAVADALGYTKPALYYYFEDKEAIFKSIVLDSLWEANERIELIRAREEAPREKLRDFIHYFIDDQFARKGFFSIHHQFKDFQQRILGEADREEVERLSNAIPQSINAIIKQGIVAGEIRSEDPKILGGIIFGMLAGLLMHLDMPALAKADRERLKASASEIIIKGIAP